MALLIRGSVGPLVTKLQTDLNTVGVTVDVDGVYGAGTEKAVKTFQTASGLKSDGAFGHDTEAKLTESLGMIAKPNA